MDLLKEQNESNKQFFANVIKGPQEIEREENVKENTFLNEGKLCFLITLETK